MGNGKKKVKIKMENGKGMLGFEPISVTKRKKKSVIELHSHKKVH